jgi:hypothetical protein
VSRIHLSLPVRILSGVRRVAKCGARCSSRYVSLHGAVPYSYPRKGVQSALDCRIQNAPPPLMPEKATSALVRPAALGRPRIPSRSSAHTARSPLVWLVLLARSCHAEPLAAGSSLRALVTQKPPAAGSSLRALVMQKPLAAGLSLRALVTQKLLAAGSSLGALVTQNWAPAVRILGGVAWSSRTRIPLEFGCSRPVPHLWLTVLTVPRARAEEDLNAANCSAAPTQQALCLRLASMYKAESCYALQPSMTRPPPTPVMCIIRVWPYATFIVFASSSSG